MKTFLNNDKGYYIEIAQNASHAFELLEKKKYHVVIVKMNIADVTGVEFIQQVRAKDGTKYQSIPLLMVSGNTMKEQQSDYFKAGANAFLAKPYTQKELFNSLEKLS
jgi:CheY-like chemotaxis protein